MKPNTLMILFLGVVSSLFAVEPPTLYSSNRYSHLWDQSIVTDKLIPIDEPPKKNGLEDWVLVGTRKYIDRQAVTILNTKDQSQRITIPSKEAAALDLTILQLKQDIENFMRTEVQLKKGNDQKWLNYDPKYLSLRTSSPTQAQSKKAPFPGLNRAKILRTQKSTGKNRPRVRYVPKPKK